MEGDWFDKLRNLNHKAYLWSLQNEISGQPQQNPKSLYTSVDGVHSYIQPRRSGQHVTFSRLHPEMAPPHGNGGQIADPKDRGSG